MTAAEIQALIDEIPCDLCNITPGLAPYAILAALVDVSSGNPVPESTQELLAEANCLACLVPSGLVPALMIQAIRGITGGSGQSCLFCETFDPVAVPPCDCALHIRTDTAEVWYWDDTGAVWVPVIANP